MDRRTLIAIVLSAVVLIGLPLLFETMGWVPKKAPPESGPQEIASGEGTGPALPGTTSGAGGGTTATDPPQLETGEPAPATPTPSGAVPGEGNELPSLGSAPGHEVEVRMPLYVARFNTRGARLLGVTLNDFTGAGPDLVQLTGTPTMALELGNDPTVNFLKNASYVADDSLDSEGRVRRLRFTAIDSSGTGVVQTYRFDPETYVIHLDVEMLEIHKRGVTDYHLLLQSWPLLTERNLDEDKRYLQTVSRVGSDIKRDKFGDLEKKGPRRHEGTIGWVAVSSKYFAFAAIPTAANATTTFSSAQEFGTQVQIGDYVTPTEQVVGGLVLPVPALGSPHRFALYAGPNDYWSLKNVGYELQDVVDLGWRWLLPFSRAVLRVMVFLKDYIPNFGLVIIVLSVLIKVVFHPLTAASMKSMRAMQKIQPEVEKVRKKFKDEPQRLNQEIMALYRDNKVNPLGGCLPMLVQMPVLIALYQVFLHAIDLRQAPFFMWINDLSSPDMLFEVAGFPIRALPLVMYGSSYLQQAMTPTDPKQKITMHLMNVFLLVIFYNLPSGLVLYWTVTNLLTAAQQFLVNRGDAPLPAKAAD